MDIFNFVTSKKVNTEKIFSQTSSDTDVEHNLKQLKTHLTNRLELGATLEKYIRDGTTPISLHWDVASNDGLEGKELDEEWYFLNTSEKKLLGIITSRRKNKLKILENKTQILKDKLSPVVETTKYKAIM